MANSLVSGYLGTCDTGADWMDHVGGAVVPKEASVFSVFVVKKSVQRDGWVSGTQTRLKHTTGLIFRFILVKNFRGVLHVARPCMDPPKMEYKLKR